MSNEWDQYEQEIRALYADHTLSTVRQIMLDRHGFSASVHAFRDWLDRWNVQRHNRRKQSSSRGSVTDSSLEETASSNRAVTPTSIRPDSSHEDTTASNMHASRLVANDRIPSGDNFEPGVTGNLDNPQDSPQDNVFSLFGLPASTSSAVDDDASTYSTVSELAYNETYISEFANRLLHDSHLEKLDDDALQRISSKLPELLKAFTIRFSSEKFLFPIHDIAVLLQKHRVDIWKQFMNALRPPRNESSSVVDRDEEYIRPERAVASRQVIDDWLDKLHGEIHGYDVNASEKHPVPDNRADDEPVPFNIPYHDVIVKSTAYAWLLDHLRKEARLVPGDPDVFGTIRRHILSSLNSPREVSRKHPSPRLQARFILDWQPLGFFADQQYHGEAYEAIWDAITLTGSLRNSQCAKCAGYMRQTWPSSGRATLKFITDLIRCGVHHQCDYMLADGTQMNAQLYNSRVVVQVYGIEDSIAEVGEQLAWLGAAFRPSSVMGASRCEPWIQDIHRVEDTIDYSIGFYMEPETHNSGTSNGQCWYGLFRSPVLVMGYPVSARPAFDTGLEIPLDIMAALVQASQINKFCGKLFIKGFSTMLVPTEQRADMILWHLVFNDNGSHISYQDAPDSHLATLDFADIMAARHIVGGASTAKHLAGTIDAESNVKKSGLRSPRRGCFLHGVDVHAGSESTGSAKLSQEHYTVGIICPLAKELLAVRLHFDDSHKDLDIVSNDNNTYTYGRIGTHNVVATCLPPGEWGQVEAARTAKKMRDSFKNIDFCLFIGSAGSVPSNGQDIRLGDIVVGQPESLHPVVVSSYDRGKVPKMSSIESRGCLTKLPRIFLSAMNILRSDPEPPEQKLQEYLKKIGERCSNYRYPEKGYDVLCEADYKHNKTQGTCSDCDSPKQSQIERSSDQLVIHYGLIASGDVVINERHFRDTWSGNGAICYEMEATGIMEVMPCLVIQGVCNYADSHQNDQWQNYAAAVAAAYAKLLLCNTLYNVRPENTADIDSHSTNRARSLSEQVP